MCLSIDVINFEVVPLENQIKFLWKNNYWELTDAHHSHLCMQQVWTSILRNFSTRFSWVLISWKWPSNVFHIDFEKIITHHSTDIDSDLWSWRQVSRKKKEFCESAKGSVHPAYVKAKDLKRWNGDCVPIIVENAWATSSYKWCACDLDYVLKFKEKWIKSYQKSMIIFM